MISKFPIHILPLLSILALGILIDLSPFIQWGGNWNVPMAFNNSYCSLLVHRNTWRIFKLFSYSIFLISKVEMINTNLVILIIQLYLLLMLEYRCRQNISTIPIYPSVMYGTFCLVLVLRLLKQTLSLRTQSHYMS